MTAKLSSETCNTCEKVVIKGHHPDYECKHKAWEAMQTKADYRFVTMNDDTQEILENPNIKASTFRWPIPDGNGYIQLTAIPKAVYEATKLFYSVGFPDMTLTEYLNRMLS